VIDVAGWLFVVLQIFFIDLLLGADNAIVVALASSRLPAEDTRRAVILGAVGAIALRLGMLMFANALLDVPLVKLIAAWMLIVIALNVRARKVDDEGLPLSDGAGAGDFLVAAAVIMLADAAMSLDNVVALAAVAGGNFWLLATGVLFSIPILAYGSLILTEILRRAPEILTLGAVVLGWIAGEMVVSDPLISGWIGANAPALVAFTPALAATFVWIAGRGAQRAPRRAQAATRVIGTVRPRRIAHEPPPQPALATGPAQYFTHERAVRREANPAAATELPQIPARGGWREGSVIVLSLLVLAALAGFAIFIVVSLLRGAT
jgi:YjbE family integral membrane protein